MNVQTMGASDQLKRLIFFAVLLCICVLPCFTCLCGAQQPAKEFAFPIEGFLVEGNTLLPPEAVQDALEGLVGPDKKSSDVETARDTLEKLYHAKGYPTVVVSIPEQSVQEGIIRIDVTESKIGKVTTTGNRFVTAEKISKGLPSMKPGEVPFTPRVQKEFSKANEILDVKVTPSLSQGSEPGTVDVGLKVEDKLPLHASVEISNRSSPETTELRLNAVLHYDNLWQRDHSLSLQYQTSPEDPAQVEVGAASYSLPAPWNRDDLILLSGIWSDSNTAFGEGFATVGKGHVFGLRYVASLPGFTNYTNNVIAGLDYKDFQNNTQFANASSSQNNVGNPAVTYFPLSLVYNSYLTDKGGVTQFNAGLNLVLRGLLSDEKAFSDNRFDAKGNYLYATLSIQRTQDLFAGAKLYVKADGQVTDFPLINNEQYAGGGLENVRGYLETEELGDCAEHCTVELRAPELVASHGLANGKLACTPYAFYDQARLYVLDALPEQQRTFDLQGTGIGVRGLYDKCVEYETCWATALSDTQHTKAGATRIHFRVKYLY